MKILVACEYSGKVREAFRKLGHNVISCDLIPSDDNSEFHHVGDVVPLLKEEWDLVVAFPPCTHLAVSGAKHFKQKIADGRQQQGIDFFMLFTKLYHIPKVAIENPIGIMSTIYRKPDQIIQPWQFGDEAQKSTCLWLKGLPKLKETNVVSKGEFVTFSSGKTMPKWYSIATGKQRQKIRSTTFDGIAKAMADQWGT